MKKMKKILAMLLAVVMVMGMSVTAFADLKENQHKANGTSLDTGTITVEGIDPEIPEGGNTPGITVTAYPIIKAKYENEGKSFVGYESLYKSLPITLIEDKDASTTTKQSVEVTQEQLNGIIEEMTFVNGAPTKLAPETEGRTLDYKNGKYSADNLPVGSYLVVVSGADAKIYSPVVVSIFYVDASQEDNTIEEGSVNVRVQDGNAWVKISSTPDIDKTSTPRDTQKVEDYDDTSVHVGDVIDYQVLINPIPYYGGKHPVFKLTDTLSEGLELVGGVAGIQVKHATVTTEGTSTKVTVGEELNKNEYAYDISINGQTLTVDFAQNENYVLNKLQGQALVVVYSAKVTDAAKFNGESNDNNATLNFSRDSNLEGSDEKKTVKTYNHTFDLSALVKGSETESMLTKVGVVIGGTETIPLADAEFTLYKDEACTEKYTNEIMKNGVVTSQEGTGALLIRGLSVGTYYMKETKAPGKYSLNDHVYKIEITADYYEEFTQNDKDGVPVTHKNKLKSYEIKVDNITIIQGTTNETDKLGAVTVDKGTIYKEIIDGEENPEYGGTDTFEIKNTQLAQLPSTGGIGTTIFTIGGCVIMIVAAGLFFATRRKAEK